MAAAYILALRRILRRLRPRRATPSTRVMEPTIQASNIAPIPRSIMRHPVQSVASGPPQPVNFDDTVTLRVYQKYDETVLYTSCNSAPLHPDAHIGKHTIRKGETRNLKRDMRRVNGGFRTCQVGAGECNVNEDGSMARKVQHQPMRKVIEGTVRQIQERFRKAVWGTGPSTLSLRLRIVAAKRKVVGVIEERLNEAEPVELESCMKNREKKALEDIERLFEQYVRGINEPTMTVMDFDQILKVVAENLKKPEKYAVIAADGESNSKTATE